MVLFGAHFQLQMLHCIACVTKEWQVSYALAITKDKAEGPFSVSQYMGGCVSGFVPVNTGLQIVLGVPFLRAWHSQFVYDPVTKSAKVGLAQAAPASTVGLQQSPPVSVAGRKLAGQEIPATAEDSSAEPALFKASIPSAKQRGLG